MYVVCGILHGFLAESWQVLDSSWLFGTTSCLFLTNFFFPRIGKSTQESSRSKKGDIKKLLRRAAKYSKTCQEVSRSVKKKKKCQEYFWKFQKMSWSFPIDQEYWRSAKKLSRSLQEVIKNDQELKFGRILVHNSYNGTAPRWTTRI